MIGERRGDVPHRIVQGDAGAALLIVLVFMTVTLILVTTMLTLSTTELVISALQGDSLRAFELAQAGLAEAVRRIEAGRPYGLGFQVSAGDRFAEGTVSVARREVGVNAAYLEVRAEAQAGRAARRLSLLVRQQSVTVLPNVVLARALMQRDRAAIGCGDVYVRGPVQYAADPNRVAGRCATAPTVTYAGWRIGVCPDPDGPCAGIAEVPPCYRSPCASHPAADTSRWYPATRLAVPAASDIGRDLVLQVRGCPAGGGGAVPDETISGPLADERTVADWPAYGFDPDDPDGAGPVPPQAVIPGVLPCGLPYRYVLVTFPRENGGGVQRYAKMVVYEQWFAAYWRFDVRKMAYVQRDGSACRDAACLAAGLEPDLAAHPQFGAIPPSPDVPALAGNYDCRKASSGSLQTLPVSCDQPAGAAGTLGCKSPEMACSPAASNPAGVVLDGDWTIDAALGGHGTLVVTGTLAVPAAFRYWGTVVAGNGLHVGPGAAVLAGGVLTGGTLLMDGDARVEAGGSVPGLPLGPSRVVVRGWWER